MQPAILVHLATALPALALGAVMLWRRKGTAPHKRWGRLWVGLMAVAALSSFWIREINDGGFSAIHLLSVWTLASLAAGVMLARRGKVRAHRGFMIGTYLGLLAAGALALAPGRLLNEALF